MANIFEIPKLGLTMEKGVLTRWRKKEGEYIEKGEVLFDLETDKISSEVESKESGFLLKILVQEGEEAKVLMPACIIGNKDENIEEMMKSSSSGVEKPETSVRGGGAQKESTAETKKRSSDGKIKISPLARRLAREHGVDISKIQPSGADGRIVKEDVLLAVQGSDNESSMLTEDEVHPLSGMRKIIAERMSESKSKIPHVYFKTTVDATSMIAIREESGFKTSYNAMIVKAVSEAIKLLPDINASCVDGAIHKKKSVNIGLAVSLDRGLVVPVIKNSESKTLLEIKNETDRLILKARENKLELDDVQGGTFTVSNLGIYDIDEFTAIINPPESGILAVGKIEERVHVKDGMIGVRPEMTLVLSVDHRTIDGAYAARFLGEIKQKLEKIGSDE